MGECGGKKGEGEGRRKYIQTTKYKKEKERQIIFKERRELNVTNCIVRSNSIILHDS